MQNDASKQPSIIAAMEDPRLFRPWFRDLKTWAAWRTALRACFALPMSDEELPLYRKISGRTEPPKTPFARAFFIAGRRSGKSSISALLAVYKAIKNDWAKYTSKGEKVWIFVIATDRAQAGIIKGYMSGILRSTPSLMSMILKETAESIELKNNVVLSVKTASWRGVRGFTVSMAVLEELSFWRSEESANPADEIVAALEPSMATIPDSMLIGISSPYSRSGYLYEQYRDHFGKVDSDTLVVMADSLTLNPTLNARVVTRAYEKDPAVAASEWGREGKIDFRSDIESYASAAEIEACVNPDRPAVIPYDRKFAYTAAIDPSGGRQDSFTLAIGHNEAQRLIVDLIAERRPPFVPAEVTEEFAGLIRSYNLGRCYSDKYAGAWVSSEFLRHDVVVKYSDYTASEGMGELLPLILNKRLELPHDKRLIVQLAQLERRPRMGGKDLICAPQGGHDDLGACLGLLSAHRPRSRDDGSSPFEVTWG